MQVQPKNTEDKKQLQPFVNAELGIRNGEMEHVDGSVFHHVSLKWYWNRVIQTRKQTQTRVTGLKHPPSLCSSRTISGLMTSAPQLTGSWGKCFRRPAAPLVTSLSAPAVRGYGSNTLWGNTLLFKPAVGQDSVVQTRCGAHLDQFLTESMFCSKKSEWYDMYNTFCHTELWVNISISKESLSTIPSKWSENEAKRIRYLGLELSDKIESI